MSSFSYERYKTHLNWTPKTYALSVNEHATIFSFSSVKQIIKEKIYFTEIYIFLMNSNASMRHMIIEIPYLKVTIINSGNARHLLCRIAKCNEKVHLTKLPQLTYGVTWFQNSSHITFIFSCSRFSFKYAYQKQQPQQE